MQNLDAVISLLALLGLCVFYTRRGLCPALAPLCALGTAVVFLLLAGVAGLLLPGAFLFAALSLSLGIFTVWRAGPRAALAPFKAPGFLLFLGFSVLALVFYAVRQPVFSHWDEFSFWGTSVKLMKLSGGLYTTAETGWFWTSTEMPALPLLGWFFQFLGESFAPWKVYFAYSVLFFACFAALAAPFKKQLPVALGLFLCGMLLPFFFLSPLRITSLSPAWLTAYGDLPAGLLFGGALVCYFALRRREKNALWALLPLAALALVKDNTFPISLVAAALMAADTLFFYKAQPGLRGRLTKGGAVLAFFAAPLAAYFLWKQHAAFANAQNVVTEGEATGASPFSAVGQSLAQLVGMQPRSDGFSRTLSEMLAAFTDGTLSPVSMAGSGLVTALLVCLLFALATALAPGKQARLRTGLCWLLSTAGFVGFQFVLLTYFAFLNKYDGGLPDYERYSASYFAGWLMLALFLLALAALERGHAGGKQGKEQPEKREHPRTARALAAQSLVLLAAFSGVFLFVQNILPGWAVPDYAARLYAPLRAEQAEAEALAARVPEGERTFYIGQGDDGSGWFRTHYYFLPHILDYSGGGGTLVPKGTGVAGEIVLPPAELREYLLENDCTYIYIGAVDETFLEEYGSLFTDELEEFTGGPALYMRAANGQYEPVQPA